MPVASPSVWAVALNDPEMARRAGAADDCLEAVRRDHEAPDDLAAMNGLDPDGIIWVRAMAALLTALAIGCGDVVAVDGVAAKRDHAHELGATNVPDPAELASTGARYDVVVEAAGNARALEAALAATAPGGRTVTAPGGRTVTVGLPHPGHAGKRLATPARGRGQDGHRQLPRIRGAVPGHPGVRPVMARGATPGRSPRLVPDRAR